MARSWADPGARVDAAPPARAHARAGSARVNQAGVAPDERSSLIVSTLLEAFEPLMQADPHGFRIKFRKMARDPFAFYRGTACLFYADVGRGASTPTSTVSGSTGTPSASGSRETCTPRTSAPTSTPRVGSSSTSTTSTRPTSGTGRGTWPASRPASHCCAGRRPCRTRSSTTSWPATFGPTATRSSTTSPSPTTPRGHSLSTPRRVRCSTPYRAKLLDAVRHAGVDDRRRGHRRRFATVRGAPATTEVDAVRTAFVEVPGDPARHPP